MRNRWYLRALGLLLVSALAMVTFSAAAEAGSSGDPLVTLSYLNDTYLPKILSQVDAKLGGQSSAAASSFTVVTLTNGQILQGDIGCEVLLRVGTATCSATSSPGLIDETAGGSIDNGTALVKNHMYMMTIEGRGVKATAATVKVMARGTYTVN